MSDKLINDILNNKSVASFLKENKLDSTCISKNLNAFTQFVEQESYCLGCKGACQSPINGLKCSLVYANGKVQVEYTDCDIVINEDEDNLEVLYYTDTNLTDIYTTPERLKLFDLFGKVRKELNNKESHHLVKGIYLHGNFGTGKSLLSYELAKKLAKKNSVIFAYYPDLVRRIQSLVTDSFEMEALISRIKTCDVLFIDDIGRENNTGFIRDGILGPILQYRCDNNKPVFFTSNRSLKNLENHLSYANGVTDIVKGKAIVERIKYLANEYELVDKDFRNN